MSIPFGIEARVRHKRTCRDTRQVQPVRNRSGLVKMAKHLDNADERRPKQERRKAPSHNAQFYCARRYHLVDRGYASIRPK